MGGGNICVRESDVACVSPLFHWAIHSIEIHLNSHFLISPPSSFFFSTRSLQEEANRPLRLLHVPRLPLRPPLCRLSLHPMPLRR